MDFVFVYITCPDEEVAKEIAEDLLEKKLIACANIFPIRSIYRWEGETKDESEQILITKTEEGKYGRVKSEVEEMHPYDVPCITEIPVSPNKDFADWIKEAIT